MLKNLYSILVLSAGLIVGIGTGSNTVAPDAELSSKERTNRRTEQTYTQRRNPLSERVTLRPKIKPSLAITYDRATPFSQNSNSSHNWFPQDLPDTSRTAPVFFNTTKSNNLIVATAGGFEVLTTAQSYAGSGGSQGFSSGFNPLYSGPPLFNGHKSFNNRDSTESITGKEPVLAPEPSTLIILGSGLMTLWYKFLRRRKD